MLYNMKPTLFPLTCPLTSLVPQPTFQSKMGALSALCLENLLAEISKGIKGSRGEIKWTMAYYNHLSIDAFFLIFMTKWGSAKQNAVLSIICQPKLFSGHWIWVTPHIPLSSQVQSFHCRLVHLQSNSTKLQPWQQWTGANFTLQSQLLFRRENLAGYWLKMHLFTFNFSTICSWPL